MALNFPNSPAINDTWPSPPVGGVPVYRWDGEKWTTAGAGVGKLPIYSDGSQAMTAALTLFGDPSNDNHAARKAYVDTMLAKAGGTMTGALTLSGAPTVDLHAATKKYADDNFQTKNAQLFAGIPIKDHALPYTLILTDAQKCLRGNSGAGAYTIPAESTVNFDIGTVVMLMPFGMTSTVTVAGGVTLYFINAAGTLLSSVPRTLGNVASATILKVASNTWVISGAGVS